MASLAFAASLLLFADFAVAAEKVLILPYQHLDPQMPDDLGEQTTVVVAKEMGAQGLEVVRSDDLDRSDAPVRSKEMKRRKHAPSGDPKAGAEASSLLEKAEKASGGGDFSKAVPHLRRAIELLERNGDAVADLRLLPEAYLALAVAQFRDGAEDEADEALRKMVHFDPARELTGNDFPPVFVRVFERARSHVLARPRARLEVRAAPGAQVSFDGRSVGRAPLMLEEVLPGVHWVRVERPGDASSAQKVSVQSKQTTRVELQGAGPDDDVDATGVLGAIARNRVTRAHVKQLEAAGRRVGAAYVMFGAVYRTDTAYQIRSAYVAVGSGKVSRLRDVAFDLDMLSAEVEVFKLAEDAKKQAATQGALVDEDPIVLARDYKPRRRANESVADDVKLTTVAIAPRAPPKAKIPDVDATPSPPAVAKAASGIAIVSPPKKAGAVPKDEAPTLSTGPTSVVTMPDVAPSVATTSADDGGGSAWWIWVAAGVLVAGAAAGGGILLFGGQDAKDASLRISW